MARRHPDGAVHVVAPARRSPLVSWPEVVDVVAAVDAVGGSAGRPCLLVVDDAERVDDPAARWPPSSPSDGTGCSCSPPGGPTPCAPTVTGRRSSAGAGPVCCCPRAPTSMAISSANCCRATAAAGPPRAGVGHRRRTASARPGRPGAARRCQPAVTAPPTRPSISLGRRIASRHDNLRPACSTERS